MVYSFLQLFVLKTIKTGTFSRRKEFAVSFARLTVKTQSALPDTLQLVHFFPTYLSSEVVVVWVCGGR